MRASILSSVLLVLLSLHFYLPTTVAASKCDQPSKIKTMDSFDLTKNEIDFFYCYSSLAALIPNQCYVHLEPLGEKTANETHYSYDNSTGQLSSTSNILKMGDNAGVYSGSAGGLSGTAYIVDISADEKCFSFFECFTGAPFTDHAAIACRDPKLCGKKRYKHMKAKITTKFLSSGQTLGKMDLEKCISLGIIPKAEK